ncbi:ribosome assembly RNA-binding protein YhbY [Dechloromonas sp. TW-R-39-2]|uniref:YhbY family RNA-binding protein n=1 Tax=Dechloromonas TaxID=73029 RepID=UPI00193CD6BE|nr:MULTISPECIES: YhbY family RNA-binding protein [Dechloromonas]QRM20331.1 ribosome assembly RNA-binding protein YhbY [Dechloromonas sp. TW-R-39-2]UCV10763.1 YhbY family RNA-binding protein [Dechloromonas denitrificans]
MLQLSSDARRELRARAHSLNPVVSIAENGLTEAVLKEIEVCLAAHELIKIRVYGDSRENRLAYYEQICANLGAAPVQHIGKLLIVYRPAPAGTPAVNKPGSTKSRRPASEPRKTKRAFQG